MSEGTVLRSHAGGYLVFEPQMMISLQCQARMRLKKERVSILTGDRVELSDVDLVKATAVITRRRDRWSLLSRPPLANVDQVVIVQALRQPEWNQLWCDRYIVHFQLELPQSVPILCFNKIDLADEEMAGTLCKIYEPLGYKVLLVSAKTGRGMQELATLLESKITVFAGPSGVGKSSILNTLEPSLNLKIGVMDHDFGVGRHTTTYSKLYHILGAEDSQAAWVADTPGFNLTELRHPEPAEVMWEFPEIARLSNECKYSNCLHIVEDGCKILEVVYGDELFAKDEDDNNDVGAEDYDGPATDDEEGTESDDEDTESDDEDTQSSDDELGTDDSDTEERFEEIENEVTNSNDDSDKDSNNGSTSPDADSQESDTESPEDEPLLILRARYENYAAIVSESQEEFNYRRTISSKVESGVKRVGGDKGKMIPRLKESYRAISRRKEKQRLSPGVVFEDELDDELEVDAAESDKGETV